MNLKRSKAIAALANMFFPGLGYIYVGRLRYAIIFPLLLILLLGISAWSRVMFTSLGFALTYLFILSTLIVGMVSAIVIARRSETEELKKYQRWYIYLGFIICSLLVNDLLRTQRGMLFGYETHRIPSSSMSQTLMLGDFIVSDTWSYKDRAPVRGDLVILSGPNNASLTYVKRVIGIPGDLIETNKGQLMLNSGVLNESYVKEHNNHRSQEQDIYFEVPKGSYYLLGDNRDNSRDSRHWGAISRDKIVGKVAHIWFSYHPKEGLKTNRIGEILNDG
ncbi:MAG: signal peptidase I [Arenicella sp.]|jgi:signal peptidase I